MSRFNKSDEVDANDYIFVVALDAENPTCIESGSCADVIEGVFLFLRIVGYSRLSESVFIADISDAADVPVDDAVPGA